MLDLPQALVSRNDELCLNIKMRISAHSNHTINTTDGLGEIWGGLMVYVGF